MQNTNLIKQPEFLDDYTPEPYSGCWIFIRGEVTMHGYALLSRKYHREGAHRYFYRNMVGPIPSGMYVLHHCDNRLCVNPDHLFIGSCKDNYVDSVNKDRHTRGSRVWIAKLNDELVREIRTKHRTGNYTLKSLGEEYNVHLSVIGKIVNLKSWKHASAMPPEYGKAA